MADSSTSSPRDFAAAPSSSSSRPISRSRSRSPVYSMSGQVPLSRDMQLLARAIKINLTLIAICCGSEPEAIEFAQYFDLIPKFIICTFCGGVLDKITIAKRSNAKTNNILSSALSVVVGKVTKYSKTTGLRADILVPLFCTSRG